MNDTFKLSGDFLVLGDFQGSYANDVTVAFVTDIAINTGGESYTVTDDLWTFMLSGKASESDEFVFRTEAAEGYTATDDLWTLMARVEDHSPPRWRRHGLRWFCRPAVVG